MDNDPLISIVCVSLDNPTYLDLMLKGLAKNTVNSFEVLVHGNMATPEFDNVVSKYDSIISVYTSSIYNFSIASRANRLFAQAKGKFFHFMDDDIYPAPGWDEALIAKVKVDMLFQHLCSTVYSYPMAHPETRAGAYNEWDYGDSPETFKEDDFNATWREHRDIIEDSATHPTGGYFIKRELFEEMGGMDESSEFGEDGIFLCGLYTTAKKGNFPIEFRTVADSCIYHFGQVGSAKPAARIRARHDGDWVRRNLKGPWEALCKIELTD